MALNFQDQGTVDLGRSRLQTPDSYQPIRNIGNDGSQMEELSKSLAKFGGVAKQNEDKAVEAQLRNSMVYAQQLQDALGGRTPTEEDVRNVYSDKHSLVAARALEDYGYLNSLGTASAAFNAVKFAGDPTTDKSTFDGILNEAVKGAGANDSYKAGIMKAYTEAYHRKVLKDADERVTEQRNVTTTGASQKLGNFIDDVVAGRTPEAVSSASGLDINNPKYAALHPEFRPKLAQFLNDAREAGIPLKMGSTFRSIEEQTKLYNNRGSNPYPVAPPGHSGHNYGLATDFAPERKLTPEEWQKVGAIARANGLTWGGDFGDPIHVQLGPNKFGDLKNAQRDDKGFVILPDGWYNKTASTEERKQYAAAVGNTSTDTTTDTSPSPPVITDSSGAIIGDNGKLYVNTAAGKMEVKPLPADLAPIRKEFLRLNDVYMRTAGADKRMVMNGMLTSIMEKAIMHRRPEMLDTVPFNLVPKEMQAHWVSAYKQIESLKQADESHAWSRLKHEQEQARRNGEILVNDAILNNKELSAQDLQQLNLISPDLVKGYNERRTAVSQGMLNQREEENKLVNIKEAMRQASASGVDPYSVNYDIIKDPASRTAAIQYAEELRKNGGELRNEFYGKYWQRALQNNYNYIYNGAVPIKGNPKMQEVDKHFQNFLEENVAEFVKQTRRLPVTDSERLEIAETALNKTLRANPPQDVNNREPGAGPVTKPPANGQSNPVKTNKYGFGQ